MQNNITEDFSEKQKINQTLVRLASWATNFRQIDEIAALKEDANTIFLDWLGSDASDDPDLRNRAVLLLRELDTLFFILENVKSSEQCELQGLIDKFGLV